ncbi:Transcription accessory protein (S1 RNA-binding domain) [hydrothermal vent metagenome]|uniref:Transcription accessory protein (S1 RNA-binding domain) n=1 Tax=hydrothermal vent metagenome TaxID=652676 RepID=A0A3B0ZMW7_9ZZZZ
MNIVSIIATELNVNLNQVEAAVQLLNEGSTVPFISRYRKEATGGLDDTQLRKLEERLHYLTELQERREAILKIIDEQGKLTDELKKEILKAETKIRLEDLYAPYKQKRRTKAQIAREAGIEPLLDSLLQDRKQDPTETANDYINTDAGFTDNNAVLDGARQIFMERVSEQADLIGVLRDLLWDKVKFVAAVVTGKEQQGEKFTDYFDYQELLKKIPSHRALAIFRGRTEGILRLSFFLEGQDDLESFSDMGICDHLIASHMEIKNNGDAADSWLLECVRWSWKVKILTQIETELTMRLRDSAEDEAINVFGKNLNDLLLAAPAGQRCTIGLDPGLRTGVKVVVVNDTGKLLDQCVIYPHQPKKRWGESLATLAALAKKYKADLMSIGNGTASRETDKLAKELIAKHPELKLSSIVVSEAGASIYSASELAAKEFPDLDVSYRGSVSIARRLQDPLAELVKIEAKAIGVGQYQHDVNQTKLSRKLDAIVEDCVNAVGVEINTASVPLLTKVSGLSESIATNIVNYREQHGAFTDRKQLLSVPRLGPKAFEQAAGFMRIQNGMNPLDASAVHPESYPVVEKIINATDTKITDIIGNSKLLNSLAANDYTDDKFGEPTVRDIIAELVKPGRDPRPEFKTASFKEGVEEVKDLKPAMILEGVVTNVTNFGAFIDIGVHQDGLVHISNISNKFVKDPREVIKTGDIVKVKVLEVDSKRKRIGLTMNLTDEVRAEKTVVKKTSNTKSSNNKSRQQSKPTNNAMAAAFAKLK